MRCRGLHWTQLRHPRYEQHVLQRTTPHHTTPHPTTSLLSTPHHTQHTTPHPSYPLQSARPPAPATRTARPRTAVRATLATRALTAPSTVCAHRIARIQTRSTWLVCHPPCGNGVCTGIDKCTCNDGYTGKLCFASCAKGFHGPACDVPCTYVWLTVPVTHRHVPQTRAAPTASRATALAPTRAICASMASWAPTARPRVPWATADPTAPCSVSSLSHH